VTLEKEGGGVTCDSREHSGQTTAGAGEVGLKVTTLIRRGKKGARKKHGKGDGHCLPIHGWFARGQRVHVQGEERRQNTPRFQKGENGGNLFWETRMEVVVPPKKKGSKRKWLTSIF